MRATADGQNWQHTLRKNNTGNQNGQLHSSKCSTNTFPALHWFTGQNVCLSSLHLSKKHSWRRQNTLGQKQCLAGDVEERCLIQTLMHKLVRMEWVSAIRLLPTSSMSKKEKFHESEPVQINPPGELTWVFMILRWMKSTSIIHRNRTFSHHFFFSYFFQSYFDIFIFSTSLFSLKRRLYLSRNLILNVPREV